MISKDVVRDLLRQSVQGLELEPTMVLADALLETDRPDLGEDLARIRGQSKPGVTNGPRGPPPPPSSPTVLTDASTFRS